MRKTQHSTVPRHADCKAANRRPHGKDHQHSLLRHGLLDELGNPVVLESGHATGKPGRVYCSAPGLPAKERAGCLEAAGQLLKATPGLAEQLETRHHAELALCELKQPSPEGVAYLHETLDRKLLRLSKAGWRITPAQLVFSCGAEVNKPMLNNSVFIRNRLACQHQDVRPSERQLLQADVAPGVPGGLRLVLDLSPPGQRWLEWRRLLQDGDSYYLSEPVSGAALTFMSMVLAPGFSSIISCAFTPDNWQCSLLAVRHMCVRVCAHGKACPLRQQGDHATLCKDGILLFFEDTGRFVPQCRYW